MEFLNMGLSGKKETPPSVRRYPPPAKKRSPPFILLLVLFFTGCTSLLQKSGEALEGSAFAEKKLALYRSEKHDGEATIELREIQPKNGEKIIEITSDRLPGFALRGSMPGGDGNFEFIEARVLSSHVYGWNEFTLDLLGNAVFSAPGETGSLRVFGTPERVQISSGKIRLKSSRFTGDAALASLRNRRERILALTEWMYNNPASAYPAVFKTKKEFETYWKPRLFPELVSKKKRPPEYAVQNAEWGRADSVKWNRTYTEFLFPEGLWEFRNSGALLRDWEEALSWIYMEYSWNYIISSFNGITLRKVN